MPKLLTYASFDRECIGPGHRADRSSAILSIYLELLRVAGHHISVGNCRLEVAAYKRLKRSETKPRLGSSLLSVGDVRKSESVEQFFFY